MWTWTFVVLAWLYFPQGQWNFFEILSRFKNTSTNSHNISIKNDRSILLCPFLVTVFIVSWWTDLRWFPRWSSESKSKLHLVHGNSTDPSCKSVASTSGIWVAKKTRKSFMSPCQSWKLIYCKCHLFTSWETFKANLLIWWFHSFVIKFRGECCHCHPTSYQIRMIFIEDSLCLFTPQACDS